LFDVFLISINRTDPKIINIIPNVILLLAISSRMPVLGRLSVIPVTVGVLTPEIEGVGVGV
jgi:hypothetical protein